MFLVVTWPFVPLIFFVGLSSVFVCIDPRQLYVAHCLSTFQIVKAHVGTWTPRRCRGGERSIMKSFVLRCSTYALAAYACLHTHLPHQSLAMGRPPAIRLSYMDCELPMDDDPTVDENGVQRIGCTYLSLCTLTPC